MNVPEPILVKMGGNEVAPLRRPQHVVLVNSRIATSFLLVEIPERLDGPEFRRPRLQIFCEFSKDLLIALTMEAWLVIPNWMIGPFVGVTAPVDLGRLSQRAEFWQLANRLHHRLWLLYTVLG